LHELARACREPRFALPVTTTEATPAVRATTPDAAPPKPGASEYAAWWVLRAAAAACFIGHGAFGVIGKSDWLPFFDLVGIGPGLAWSLMLVIGAFDILVGLSMLWRPMPATLAYMAVWAVWTASLRPLTGLSAWELVERAGNYGVPVALLAWTWSADAWLRPFARLNARSLGARAPLVANVLAYTTALLLIGHGALAFEGKPLLDKHLIILQLPTVALAAQGWIEVTLGIACALTRSRALLLVAFAWKVATESLYLFAGAWVWEFVERSGSYGAPLAFALIAGTAVSAMRSGRARTASG
jgi:hypothetical protein